MKNQLFFTPEELRSVLPVGRSQIYKMLRAGEIPSIRMGKKFVVPVRQFERWIESCGGTQPAA